MSSQNIVQYLEAGVGTSVMNRGTTQWFLASGAIVKGDAVSFDLAQAVAGDKTLFVAKGSTGAFLRAFVGIAIDDAADGERVQVQTSGLFEDANVGGTTVAGSQLCLSSTAGQLLLYATGGINPIVAFATEAGTGNLADVLIVRRF